MSSLHRVTHVKDERSMKMVKDPNQKHYFPAARRVLMKMNSYVFCANLFKLEIMHAADQKKLMNGFILIHWSTFCTSTKKHFRDSSNGTGCSFAHLIMHPSGSNGFETILHID